MKDIDLKNQLENSLQKKPLLAKMKEVDLETARANSWLGMHARAQGVQPSDDFFRVRDLPWRDVEEIYTPEFCEELSSLLRTPSGTMTLHPHQAAVLCEFGELRGAIGSLGVGAGKTLVCALAPRFGETFQRPLVLTAKNLCGQMKSDLEKLQRDWVFEMPAIESYERIARSGDKVLEALEPDVILADEVTFLKNPTIATTRKITRYGAKYWPAFMGLSGTLIERHLTDFWHLLWWALGADRMPLPFDVKALKAWSLAVDEKVPEEWRMRPGVLLDLAPGFDPKEGESERSRGRRALGARLRATPGFVVTETMSCGASIVIEGIKPPHDPDIAKALLETTSDDPMNLQGARLARPVDVWRVQQQISLGFYLRWEPEPPEEWLMVRNFWFGYVRDKKDEMSDIDSGIDSDADVVKAVREGVFTRRYKGHSPQDLLQAWEDIEGTYTYETIPTWISTSVVEWIANVFLSQKEPLVLWVGHPDVGKKLSEISNVSFFHNLGFDARGRYIGDCSGEHVIASIKANKKGRHLPMWSRNFVTTCPTKGADWEQLLGRTHRQHQKADLVYCGWLETVGNKECFAQARREAQMMQEVNTQRQRLNLANYI